MITYRGYGGEFTEQEWIQEWMDDGATLEEALIALARAVETGEIDSTENN